MEEQLEANGKSLAQPPSGQLRSVHLELGTLTMRAGLQLSPMVARTGMVARTKAMTWKAMLATVVALCLAAGTATAQTPSSPYALSYGGRLADQAGKPISGPIDLKVSFFANASGGSPLASQTFSQITLDQGVFQVTLDVALQDVFSGGSSSVYVEVSDVTHSQTYPRQILMAVPYALRVPTDGSTVSFNSQGKLTVGPEPAPGANQFLTKDSGGNLVWGTPSTDATQIGGVAVALGTPSSGEVLKYVGGTWQPTSDTSLKTQGLQTLTSTPASPVVGETWYDTTDNVVKYWDGSAAQTLGTSSGGIQSLNGLTSTTANVWHARRRRDVDGLDVGRHYPHAERAAGRDLERRGGSPLEHRLPGFHGQGEQERRHDDGQPRHRYDVGLHPARRGGCPDAARGVVAGGEHGRAGAALLR